MSVDNTSDPSPKKVTSFHTSLAIELSCQTNISCDYVKDLILNFVIELHLPGLLDLFKYYMVLGRSKY